MCHFHVCLYSKILVQFYFIILHDFSRCMLISPVFQSMVLAHFPMYSSGNILLYCFYASLGQPLSRCIIVSVFVPHDLHLGETGCLSFALIALVLSAWPSNSMPSVSFFLNLIHFPENVCAIFLVFSTNCTCNFPSCSLQLVFLACICLLWEFNKPL